MKVYLKVKIKSLAIEAKIIRKEELKRRGDDYTRYGLYRHRLDVVRPESRSALLAYGFLRGRPYKKMEAKCYLAPDWERVQKLIEKYGEGDVRVLRQEFAAWKEAA